MLKKASILSSLVLIFLLSGCATSSRHQDLQAQGLKNQVSVLEAQIQAKDEELVTLRNEVDRLTEEKDALVKSGGKNKVIGEVKSRPNAKQIQIALNNAGFSPGRIDGKLGKKTRQAIKAFQKENKLLVDGRVGKRTWALLRGYLYKKVK